jgi:hypothetical protein
MVAAYPAGTRVHWAPSGGECVGTVKRHFTKRIVRTFKGKKVVCQGDEENPAYLIEKEDGEKLLKPHHELEPRPEKHG